MLLGTLILLLLLSIAVWTAAAAPPRQAPAARMVLHIDRLLPQTQCGQCGFAGCLPYAQAIARGRAGVELCPPGGPATARALAGLLGLDAPLARLPEPRPRLVYIDPQRCIGCAKCLSACPVDAIVGARRQLHVVLADRCTGCMLCLPPCPVDCILEIEPGRAAQARPGGPAGP